MKKKYGLKKRKALVGYSFISFWIIGVSVFFLFPIIFSLIFSFSEIQNAAEFSFKIIGFDNYVSAFVEDIKFVPYFTESVKDSIFNLFLILFFSFFIAIILNRKIKFRGFFRVTFFLPVILGTGFILDQILGENLQQQSVNIVRDLLFTEDVVKSVPAGFLDFVQEFLNRITVILWNSGVQILFFLTGLQSISITVYEAAQVDAAGEWEQFWLITLPMMAPTILLNIVYTIVSGFMNSSNKALTYIIDTAFAQNKLELSSAMGWVYFLFILFFIGIAFLIMKPAIKRIAEK